MPLRIAILHYASPPSVGGVESVIGHQVRELIALGYAVRVVSGSGQAFSPAAEFHFNPLFSSKHPDVLALKESLDAGIVPPAFEAMVEQQTNALRVALHDCDVCIAHNIHTLNKSLSLTAALVRLDQPRMIAFCHDIAWTNPQYQPELYDRYPYDLLRQPQPNTPYITVSQARRAELAGVLGVAPDTITVASPGIDPAGFFRWSPLMVKLEAQLQLLNADGLLLLPARLTRRKNIQLGLPVLAAIRQHTGKDFRLIITGPPGPHNPTNPGYLGELLALRERLGLTRAAHFLYELDNPPLMVDDVTLSNLYQTADALFFPSVQEGFGIPILEAGLVGLPIFCTPIPPFQETGQSDIHIFDPVQQSPDQIAALIIDTLNRSEQYRLRVRVRHQYRWDVLTRTTLVPLLEA